MTGTDSAKKVTGTDSRVDKRHTIGDICTMRFVWKEDKNEALKQQRNISFEQILLAIENNQIVDVIEHPNKRKYAEQVYIMVKHNEYIYVVPAIIASSGEECHLITVYPSRKYTKKYLGEKDGQNEV